MKKRIILLLLAGAMLLSACEAKGLQRKKYQATFLTLFDTVTTVVGYGDSEEAFTEQSQMVYDALLRYHQLFDIYHEYEGMNNLKTVNDQAGVAPVAVDEEVIRLLLDCREYDALTDGRVDVTMGSVLQLWHEARERGNNDPEHAQLPDQDALAEAAIHRGWDRVEINETEGTVYITDPELKLDVGAVAKGWSTQRVAETAPAGLLISVGGNVCATGPKDGDAPWVVGINDPDGGDAYLHTLNITGGSVVTSGDYQRYYMVDGVRYHHIIDPDTLCPSTDWRSVTIVCDDSGLADALSTALFLLPLERGKELLAQCGAEAMWVDGDGNFFYSPGFEGLIRT